jgi:hypothetical protein
MEFVWSRAPRSFSSAANTSPVVSSSRSRVRSASRDTTICVKPSVASSTAMISDEKAMKILVRSRARAHHIIRPTARRV